MNKAPKTPLTPQERKQKEDAFMKDITDSMTTSMMMVVSLVVFLPVILQALGTKLGITGTEALATEGRADNRELQADPMLRWIDLIADPPYTAWVYCFIINDGPGAVQIAINQPNDRFTMGPGETRTINKIGAKEQILSIFYVSEPGLIANLRITGGY